MRAIGLVACLGLLFSATGCMGSASRPPDPKRLAHEIEALHPHAVWADYAARDVTCTVRAQTNEAVCEGWLVRKASRDSTTPGMEAVPRVGAGFLFRINSTGDLGRPICVGESSVAATSAFCDRKASS